MRSESVRFSQVVRSVAREARQLGLAVPVFRAPPRDPERDRTMSRRHGQVVIAVRLRGRPFADVVADVIDGVIIANGIGTDRDLAIRHRLLDAVEADLFHAA